jgi:hypothetical protein
VLVLVLVLRALRGCQWQGWNTDKGSIALKAREALRSRPTPAHSYGIQIGKTLGLLMS